MVEGGGRVVAGELLEVRVDLDAAKLLRLDERDELGRDDATQGGEVEERVVLETVRDLHRRHLAPQVPLAVEAEQLGIAESSGGPARSPIAARSSCSLSASISPTEDILQYFLPLI